MRLKTVLGLIVGLLLLAELKGEEQTPDPQQLKSERYLKLLVRKPRKGYLFDRFYDSWMKFSTPEKLEALLEQRYQQDKNRAYLKLLALLLEKEDRNNDALAVYDELLKEQPKAVDILYQKALLDYYERHYSQAETALRTALTATPDAESAVNVKKLLGKVYIKKQQPQKGLAIWQALLKQEPANVELGEEVIQLQLTEGLTKEAADSCRHLIGRTKKVFKKLTLQLRLADIYRMQNQNDKAIALYTELLNKLGSSSWMEKEILSRVGATFKSEDDLKGLLAWYQTQIKRFPNKIGIRKLYADSLYDAGKVAQALETFREIIRKAPLNKPYREHYIALLLKTGKTDKALEVLDELIKQHREDAELYLQKADIEHQLEHPEQLFQALKQYINFSGSTESSYVKAARLLQRYKLNDRALVIYNELVRQFPDSGDAAEMRLVFCYQNNHKEEALRDAVDLAAKLELHGVIRLVKVLLGFKEIKTARQVLELRATDFSTDYDFNQQYYTVLTALREYRKGLAIAKKQLAQATSFQQIAIAAANVIYLLNKTGQTTSFSKELMKRQQLSVNEICLLADLFLEIGNIKQALLVIDDGLKHKPGTVILLQEKMKVYRKNYDYANIMAILKQLMTIEPQRKSYYIRELAVAAQKAGQDKQALTYLAQWRVLSPGAVTPYIMEARIYDHAGNLEKAIQTIRRTSRLFPENRELKFTLAGYYVANDDFDAALDLYWRIIRNTKEVKAKMVVFKKLLGLAKKRQEKDSIVKKLHKMNDATPGKLFPLLALAETGKAMGDVDKQRQYLKEAARNRKHDLSLLHELAKFAELEGDYDQALTLLKKAEKVDKTDQTSQRIALFYLRHNEEEKGFRKMIDLLGGGKMTADALKATVLALFKANRLDLAENVLKKNIAQFTDNFQLQFLYAVNLEANNNLNQAVEQFLNVLKIVSKQPGAAREFKRWRKSHLRYIYVLNFYDDVKEIMLIQFLVQNRQLLSNRYSGSRLRHLAAGLKSSGQNVPLPELQDEARVFVMAHLARFFYRLSKAEQLHLLEELKRLGIEYPAVKLSMARVPLYFNKYWDQLYQKYPDDQVVACLWSATLLNGSREQNKVKVAYDKFRDKLPRLAVNIAVNSIDKTKGPVDEEMVRDMIKVYDRLPERNPSVFIYRLCNFLSDRSDISPQLRQEVIETCLDLHQHQIKSKKAFKRYYLYLYFMLLNEKRYKELTSNLLAHFTKDGSDSIYSRKQYSLFQYSILSNPHLISFPPSNLPDFPEQVLEFFRLLKQTRGHFSFTRLRNFDSNELWNYAKTIQQPALKILFGDLCGKRAEVNQLINSLTAKSETALPLLLLAGFYKYHNAEFSDAVALFEKALPYAMNRKLKKDIYSIIIQACAPGAGQDKALRKIGRETIAKYVKMRISQQDKSKLVSLLNKYFDDPQAAEKLAKTITSRSSSRGTVVKTSRQRLDELLKKGRVNEAMAIALREFRKLVTPYLAVPVGNAAYHANFWQLKQLYQQLLRHKSVRHFLAKLNPGTGSQSIARQLEYGFGCELCGFSNKALQVYQNVLKRNPNNRSAAFRLAMLTADTNRQQAEKYLKVAIGNNVSAFGNYLAGGSMAEFGLKRRLALVELLIDALKKQKHMLDIDHATWFTSLLYQLEKPVQAGAHRVPGLFDHQAQCHPVVTSLIEKRIQLYLKLCDLGLTSREKAMIVFPSKVLLLEKLGRVDEQLYREAKAIISEGFFSRQSRMRHSLYLNRQQIRLKTPFEFLVEYATANGKEEDLFGFINQLSGDEKQSSKTMLQAVEKLEQVPKNEFLKAAAALMRLDVPENLDIAHYEADLKFKFILMIYNKRLLTMSLTPLVMDEIKRIKRDNPYYLSRISFPMEWAGQLLKQNRLKQAMDYYQQVVRLVGTRYFSPVRQPIHGAQHDQEALIRKLALYMVNRKRGMIFPVLTLYTKPEYERFFDSYARKRQQPELFSLLSLWYKQPDMLAESPWVKPFDQFEFIVLPGNKSLKPLNLLKYFVRILHGSYSSNALAVKTLKTLPNTFGRGLLEAALDPKQPASIYSYVAAKLPDIKQADKSRQHRFLEQFLNAWKPVAQLQNNADYQKIKSYYKTLKATVK